MSSKPGALPPPRFLAVCLGLVALLWSPLLLSYRYLATNGETLSPVKIVDRLEHQPEAFYRSIMHDNLRETALEIIRRRQPEVIALGSSLTLDFREEYFTRPFACAGGVMDTLADGDEFVMRMLKVAQPKVVLFILNFWWFTDAEVPRRGSLAGPKESPRLSFSQLRLPYKQLSRKEITAGQLFGWEPLHATNAIDNIPLGLMAHFDHVGRRSDGSQLNGLVFTDKAWDFYAPVRQRFAHVDAFVLESGRFGPDMQIRPDRLTLLRRIIQRLETAGTHVILVNPPMAPPLVAAMSRSGRHQYYFQFGDAIQKLGAEAYDFREPATLGIPAAEFADTHHAGNTAYMRLLLEIAKRSPASPLAGQIDQPKLAEWVQRFAGNTVAILAKDRIRTRETDFLGLGVQKAAPAPGP
ncbi:MAG: hypothetical protein U0984_09245 [Prosthecobacter sp.]|nr:hypothetical protein [Prosthecobacter sp.]